MKKDTKLRIECTLLGGLLPQMKIQYQNSLITVLFPRKIWDDLPAIESFAKEVVERCNEKRSAL